MARSSAYRSNLILRCERKQGISQDLQKIHSLTLSQDATIVYASSKAEVERVHEYLIRQQVIARFYHGGCSPAEREAAHLAFLSGQIRVIVATVAFGMGIDKPDIRQVIHYGAPKTV